jgi:hypothetical protein
MTATISKLFFRPSRSAKGNAPSAPAKAPAWTVVTRLADRFARATESRLLRPNSLLQISEDSYRAGDDDDDDSLLKVRKRQDTTDDSSVHAEEGSSEARLYTSRHKND